MQRRKLHAWKLDIYSLSMKAGRTFQPTARRWGPRMSTLLLPLLAHVDPAARQAAARLVGIAAAALDSAGECASERLVSVCVVGWNDVDVRTDRPSCLFIRVSRWACCGQAHAGPVC